MTTEIIRIDDDLQAIFGTIKRLNVKCFEQTAKLLGTVLSEMDSKGISKFAITLTNEPEFMPADFQMDQGRKLLTLVVFGVVKKKISEDPAGAFVIDLDRSEVISARIVEDN